MGRHSRKGPAPQGADTGAREAAAADRPGTGRRRRGGVQAPAPGADGVRGGHPEHREAGGGWGGPQDWSAGAGPRQRTLAPPATGAAPRIPGPRQEFLEAFDDPGAVRREAGPGGGPPAGAADPAEGAEPPARGGRGRTATGIAAAAVTTVLAVVVAGQVADGGPQEIGAQSAGQERGAEQVRPDRSEGRPTPSEAGTRPSQPAEPPGYEQLMASQFEIDPGLEGSGEFEAVPGADRVPGTGRTVRYRIDVEKGLPLDSSVFARAVQETLNDDRSWSHGGAMTFERISTGEPEFVITLASPGTTGVWCAKSGLDTTVDNVSCDSAATERVMINAFRWARGAETYGPELMLEYRQMLINHEVGHRLGHNHVNCATPGALAPVMQQQTKTLEINGVACRANPWVHPGG
ncbi:DUF3152 domain-containing protein [Streptomyces sp. C10-9-1]|uniref:DUF3152 domain-containing protein n=1 Tax=Streptomyces sp. C10-9-1 TaxID=1859285 RepID=UPI003D712C2D